MAFRVVPSTPHGDVVPAVFPFDLRWTAQDLADAVPLRLHPLLRFDAASPAPAARDAAPRRGWRNAYAPRTAAALLFRIQG